MITRCVGLSHGNLIALSFKIHLCWFSSQQALLLSLPLQKSLYHLFFLFRKVGILKDFDLDVMLLVLASKGADSEATAVCWWIHGDWGRFKVYGMDRDQSIQGKQLIGLVNYLLLALSLFLFVAETPYLTFALFPVARRLTLHFYLSMGH